jgi:hypothetical protein
LTRSPVTWVTTRTITMMMNNKLARTQERKSM